MSTAGSSVRTCYRHPDAVAGVVCQRCDRPICPQCMHQASVGFHCPECVAEHHTKVVRAGALRPTQPVVTWTLIAINTAVWLLGQVLWRTSDLFTTSNGAIRAGGLFSNGIRVDPATNLPMGSLIGVAHGEWYRLVSGGFVHANIIHLGMNMWALYVLGRLTEQLFGRTRMGLIYMVSLLAGSVGALLYAPDSLTVGASGAIFGLMGAVLVVAKARGMAMRDTGLLWVLGINLLLTFGLSSYISVGAHIGGLIGGGIAGLLIIDVPLRLDNASRQARQRVSVAIGVVLLVVFFAAGVIVANAHTPGRVSGVAHGPAVVAPPPSSAASASRTRPG